MNSLFTRIFLLLLVMVGNMIYLYAAEDEFILYEPSYFGEQDFVFEDIHYLEKELLSFKLCSDSSIENVSAYLLCGDTSSDLPLSPFFEKGFDSCIFSTYKLSDFSCDDFSLEVTYTKDNVEKSISRTFTKQKESQVITSVLNQDISELTELELSYYLAVYANVETKDSQKANDIYELLKSKRDNDEKCWPKNSCDFITTMKILENLDFAGYSEDSRLLEDGRILFEQQVIDEFSIDYSQYAVEEDSPIYTVEIRVDETISQEVECELNLDSGDDIRTYLFEEGGAFDEYVVVKKFQEDFTFECEDEVDELQYRIFDERIFEESYSNEDRFSYELDANDLGDFEEFRFELHVTHDTSSENVSCSFDVDGDSQDFSLKENAQKDNVTIFDEFTGSLELDCDADVDDIFLSIYAGDFEERIEENTNTISEEKASSSSSSLVKTVIYPDYIFEGDETISCEITTDNQDAKTYLFDKGDKEDGDFYIEDLFSSTYSFSCDRDLRKITYEVYDLFQRKQIEEELIGKSSFSYRLPSDFSKYSCVAQNSECSFLLSLGSVKLFSDFIHKTSLENYVKSLVQKNSSISSIDTSQVSDAESSGRFLYTYPQQEELRDSLKFIQNNDGSWGDGTPESKIEQTSWGILGLQETSSAQEYVLDAKKWVYYEEPEKSWSSLEKNALAYLAIKEQIKPYVEISNFSEFTSQLDLLISNPTFYTLNDISLSFDEELSQYLSYTQDLGDLSLGESVTTQITPTQQSPSDVSGYLSLTAYSNQKEITLLELPILLRGAPLLQFNETTKVFVSEGSSSMKVPFSVLEEFPQMSCSYTSPFDNNKNKELMLISSLGEVQLENPSLLEGNFSLELLCTYDSKEMKIPLPLEVLYVEKAFEIPTTTITFSTLDDISIPIKSSLKDKQIVSMELSGDLASGLEVIEESKIIAANDSRELFLSISDSSLFMNSSFLMGEVILTSDQGYSQKVSLVYEATTSSQEVSYFWPILISLLVIVLALVLVRAKRIQKQEEEQSHSSDEEELYFDENLEFK